MINSSFSSYNSNFNNRSGLASIDWITIIIYLLLIFMGWVSIYAAVYNEDHGSMFDMTQKYGSQIFWIGVCSVCGILILLFDNKYYHYLAYHIYILMIVVLVAVLIFGREVNGARSWFQIGSFRLQPAEFAKVATALALARYMSSYGFDINKIRNILTLFLILGLPAIIVIMQNDTGSALVYGAFVFMLFREGFNRWLYIIIILLISLFILTFVVEQSLVIYGLIVVFAIIEGLTNGRWDSVIRYLASLSLGFFVATILNNMLFDSSISPEYLLIAVAGVSIVSIIRYSYINQIRNTILLIAVFLCSTLYLFSVNYVFENIMKLHQQKRILNLLGLEHDVKNWGYNVNQSKIAIGSGGLTGKGFLKGTQTKFDFVPEQSTDFIFCTIGEEWGFVGSSLVIILFIALIFRLMRMGDRQIDSFGRIYCYGVASIILFHVIINIGMTIGLVPVIGIPLPFFSYGGSSLLAFTVMLFIAIRLDSARTEVSRGY